MNTNKYDMSKVAGSLRSPAARKGTIFCQCTAVLVGMGIAFLSVGCALGEVATLSTSNDNGTTNNSDDKNGGSGVEGQTDTLPTDDIDSDDVANAIDVDDDGDGLIEIHDLVMLSAIRYDLDGTHYDDEADDGIGNEGDATGCPSAGCSGYELARSLDFTDDGSYPDDIVESAWRPNQGNLGAGDNAGWEPIGASSSSFSAIFDGNGHTVSNLYIRILSTQSGSNIVSGLFGTIAFRGTVRNIRLADANVYGKATAYNKAGILAGQNMGKIISSHATGNIYGQAEQDGIGGLVGENQGAIIGSGAAAQVYGGGRDDYVGGLVGENLGDIIASFSSGAVHGGEGADYVGGLTGGNSEGIISSYSQAATYGDGGDDKVGGLIGINESYVAGSYATGDSDGGSGNSDAVGGFAGYNYGTINANYSSGAASNGVHLGALVGDNGLNPTSGIRYSYAFDASTTVVGRGSAGTALPTGVTNAADLTSDPDAAGYAGASWDSASSQTLGAWDFRGASQTPVVQYSDYDGTATGAAVYRCVETAGDARFVIPHCGTAIAGQ